MNHPWLVGLVGGSVLMASAVTTALVTGGNSSPSPHYVADTSCDVDGVETGYEVAFSGSSSDFRVSNVAVRNISPTCEGGTATVILSRTVDSTELGRGSVLMDASGTATVAIGPLASAEDGTNVRVELAGGEVPVPRSCQDAGMDFDRITVGDVDDESLTGTSRRDLIFALPGDDVVTGRPGDDCLDGAPGNDKLDGEEGDDVVLGGDGDDTLLGGVGRDVVEGGAGGDRLEGGAGNDVLRGGDGDDTIVGGTGQDECIGGAGSDTFVSCETVVHD